MKLYFIALLPPAEIRAKVKALKEEMKARFGVKHALKSPAHITLQMPFKRTEEEEFLYISTLEELASRQSNFDLRLSGFDCFAPRVIFVHVEREEALFQLHTQLNRVLTRELRFQPGEIQTRLHPHLTIATRDLHRSVFHEVWPEFEKRSFEASFEVDSLFLLRHNGRYWEVYREFGFGE